MKGVSEVVVREATTSAPAEASTGGRRGDRYRWVALSNTTLGMLMAMVNSSIILIALPNIFRGIGLDPLSPGNSGYLLWMLMGFLVVTAVLVVSLGRIGDMFGRVRMYNLGFAVFSAFSILLAVTWMHGTAGALWLILMRVGQGLGAALLMANTSAILTDAFPPDQRGLALGINNVAGIAGSFIGLVLGGVLAPLQWHLVFLVSVPFGVAGTVWAYLKLEDRGQRRRQSIDWWGNATFAAGLILFLVGIVYSIEPYGKHSMGWTNPKVFGSMVAGMALLAIFVLVESKVENPMFNLGLFRIRAFSAGNASSLLAALARGGLMFTLIIWLQGIWLPQHGYDFAQTPLWAGIYMVPLTLGLLLAGPASGWLADRFGARPFATGGMVGAAASFIALQAIPANFAYWIFAALIFANGLSMGLFSAPNLTGIMNSLPADKRGQGGGMASTFQFSAMVLSIGIFFSLMIVGLSARLPSAMLHGLISQGVPRATAERIAHLPPVGLLFAAFLGYNPMKTLLGPKVLGHLSRRHQSLLTGRSYFPHLLTGPFGAGLSKAFLVAAAFCALAAVASWMRGGKFHYMDAEQTGR
jgi:MFS family permease